MDSFICEETGREDRSSTRYRIIFIDSDWRKWLVSARKIMTRKKDQQIMEEVDRILDKINQVGYDNLTRREKKILEDASDQLSKK